MENTGDINPQEQVLPPQNNIESGLTQTTPPKKSIAPRVALLIFAVVIFSLSALATFYVIKTPQPALPTPTPAAVQPTIKPLFLSLASPTADTLVTDDQVTIKGETLPNTTVTFYTEENQESTESGSNGKFEGQIALVSGINTLIVSAFAESGEEKSLTLDLVYDDQVKGAKTENPSSQSGKNQGIENKVTIGDVERVSTSSITLEARRNKLKTEAMVDKKTQIINREKRKVSLNSIKPKDLVAVISSESSSIATSGGNLKRALKIFVREATSSAQLKRQALQGVVTGINGSTITLAHQTQRDRTYNLLTNAQTVVKIKSSVGLLSDLSVGQRIAVVGNINEDGTLIAKLIHVIPGKGTGVFRKNPVATPSATISISPTATLSGVPSTTPSATPSTTATPTATFSPTP